MGKFKFIVLCTLICTFVSCSKSNDEIEIHYTNNQQTVFRVFNGEWYDTQFATVINDKYVNGARIVFQEHFDKPQDIYVGNTYKYSSHGNCRFYPQYYDGYIQCSYYVSPNGETLDLHDKSNNSLYHYYSIVIESDTKVRLHQNGVSLPYIFVKSDNPTK